MMSFAARPVNRNQPHGWGTRAVSALSHLRFRRRVSKIVAQFQPRVRGIRGWKWESCPARVKGFRGWKWEFQPVSREFGANTVLRPTIPTARGRNRLRFKLQG